MPACPISPPTASDTHLHAWVRASATQPEEFKAWSQNLGHEGVLTTFFSYGEVSEHRQGEIIQGLITKKSTAPVSADEIAEAVARKLRVG